MQRPVTAHATAARALAHALSAHAEGASSQKSNRDSNAPFLLRAYVRSPLSERARCLTHAACAACAYRKRADARDAEL